MIPIGMSTFDAIKPEPFITISPLLERRRLTDESID